MSEPLDLYRPSNGDALAIRWALECSYPGLRKEAERIVVAVIERHQGRLIPAAAELGITKKTLGAWLDRNENLRKVRNKVARERETGTRLPREIEADVLREKAKANR